MYTIAHIARRAICAARRRRVRSMHNGLCTLEPMILIIFMSHQRGGKTPPRTHVNKDVKKVPEEVALGTALPLGEACRTRPKEGQVSCIIAPAT